MYKRSGFTCIHLTEEIMKKVLNWCHVFKSKNALYTSKVFLSTLLPRVSAHLY